MKSLLHLLEAASNPVKFLPHPFQCYTQQERHPKLVYSLFTLKPLSLFIVFCARLQRPWNVTDFNFFNFEDYDSRDFQVKEPCFQVYETPLVCRGYIFTFSFYTDRFLNPICRRLCLHYLVEISCHQRFRANQQQLLDRIDLNMFRTSIIYIFHICH